MAYFCRPPGQAEAPRSSGPSLASAGTCSSSNNAASCQCATGWTGTRCQTRADPCATNPCKNGGTCATVNGKANCTCAAGFVGKRCETSAACSPNPCLNGAKCYVDGGGTQGVPLRRWWPAGLGRLVLAAVSAPIILRGPERNERTHSS